LNDAAMIVDYTGTTPIDDIRAYLRAGYNLDAWDGNGIVSSTIAASPTGYGRLGIGYYEPLQRSLTSIYGDPFDATSIVLESTLVGDANFDGSVNIGDLGQIALAWNQSGTWFNGDFNYDGMVNVRDLYIFASIFTAPNAPQPAMALDTALASLGLPPVTAVPEPSALLAAIGLGALSLRRRH
jgi:hypothetical protein